MIMWRIKMKRVDVGLELLESKLDPLGRQNKPKQRERRSVGMRRRKLVLGRIAGPTRVEEKESKRRRE